MGTVTYIALNVSFIIVGCLALLPWIRQSWRHLSNSLLHLIPLTLIFDSLIIMAGIVAYDTSKILGISLWHAPVEDFLYSIGAALFIPALWRMSGTIMRTHRGDNA